MVWEMEYKDDSKKNKAGKKKVLIKNHFTFTRAGCFVIKSFQLFSLPFAFRAGLSWKW